MSLLDDDSDGISRRALLGGGLAAFLVGAVTAGEDGEETFVGAGGPTTTAGDFGEWTAVVTTDWGAVSLDDYPALAYHVDEGAQLFLGDVRLPVRTTVETLNTTMETIITNDIADAEINRYPTLVFEVDSDGGLGSQTLFDGGGV